MKKFMAVGVSSILYVRATELPLEVFNIKELGGTKVAILNRKNSLSNGICDAIVNASQALKRGYLKKFELMFYSSGTKDVIEVYQFNFSVPSNKRSENVNQSTENEDQSVVEATRRLLKNLVRETQTNKVFPGKVDLDIRLFYTEDTPETYNPPGFVTMSPRSLSRKLVGAGSTVRIGNIKTNWHKVSAQMQ